MTDEMDTKNQLFHLAVLIYHSIIVGRGRAVRREVYPPKRPAFVCLLFAILCSRFHLGIRQRYSDLSLALITVHRFPMPLFVSFFQGQHHFFYPFVSSSSVI